jgi:hypothetical protein
MSNCQRSLGLVSLEADIGALGSLVRLGHHEAASAEDPPDRRDRRRVTVPLLEVEGDGVGAIVMTQVAQLLTELDHFVLDGLAHPMRAAPRST